MHRSPTRPLSRSLSLVTAASSRSSRARLVPALALLAVAACDCEAMLASKRGNEPVYRVAGGRNEETPPALPDRPSASRVARQRPSPAVARGESAPAPSRATSPSPSSAQGPAHRPLPVMPSTPPPAPEAREDGRNERQAQRQEEAPLQLPERNWGRGRINPFGFGQRIEPQIGAIQGRPLIHGADGRPGFVETPMGDGPSMQFVPGALPGD